MNCCKRVQMLFWLAVLPFSLSAANAQNAAPEPPGLSSQSKTVLNTLAAFSTLPPPAWRYHLGDLPHGEDPALNDSSWQAVSSPATLPEDAMWFRASIEIPKTLHGYDISGAEVSFRFRVDANGPVPQIVYFNGRRVALGTDLEPITLFDHAHPGDKVLVAVKLLHTEDQKRFRGSEESIQFAANRPNPEDFRAEAVSAAFLLPAVESDPAGSLQKLQAAIHTVNLSALDSGNQAGFDDSLRQAQSQIMALRPVLQRANIHLTGNSHIDAAWLWPWTETVEVVRQTFGTALQLMNEYPKYTYSASAAAYYDWMQQKYPSEFEQIQQRVKEGRWEVLGGMWVEPDLNMPDGESQVRQLLIGKRYFEKNFGVDVRIGWNPDSFGYNWQLPQIYKRSGVDYFVTQKMTWNDTNQLPLKLFWWQSPDGSRVLTYFPHGYSNSIEPIDMASAFAGASELNPGTREMMHLYGVGDHGGGPTRAMLDAGDRWTEPDKAFAQLNFGVASTFFSAVEDKLDTAQSPVWNYETMAAGNTKLPQPPAGELSLPVWNDELYLEFHRGVFTTQAKHKRSMREAEEQMLDAEKWSSIAWLSGAKYPGEQLNEAWKKVLFNQFHDLAAGSGIAPIYKDAQKDYQMVRFTSGAATHGALDDIASYIDTQTAGKEVPVVVFNPLAWVRTDPVSFTVQMPVETSAIEIVDRAGKVLNAEASVENPAIHTFRVNMLAPDVPSLGYEVVYAKPADGQAARANAGRTSASGLSVSSDGMTLENEFLAGQGRSAERLHHQPDQQAHQLRRRCRRQLRQPAAGFQRHAEAIRRLEYRRGFRQGIYRPQDGRFGPTHATRFSARRYPCDPALAGLQICPGHHPLQWVALGGSGERYRLARASYSAQGGLHPGGLESARHV